MATEASTLESMIAEARQTQLDGKYINGRVFHAMADEIERLRKIQKRLDDLARGACGHIANKGIADDFRKNITLCQSVDL